MHRNFVPKKTGHFGVHVYYGKYFLVYESNEHDIFFFFTEVIQQDVCKIIFNLLFRTPSGICHQDHPVAHRILLSSLSAAHVFQSGPPVFYWQSRFMFKIKKGSNQNILIILWRPACTRSGNAPRTHATRVITASCFIVEPRFVRGNYGGRRIGEGMKVKFTIYATGLVGCGVAFCDRS